MDAILMSDDQLDIAISEAIDQVMNSEANNLDDTLFSMWLKSGDEYSPAVNFSTCKELPSNVYKVVFKNNDYTFIPLELNTDEIYTFSKSFTVQILEEIEDFWSKKEIYKQYHVMHKRGILLEGSPGCGKSALITLLIKQLKDQNGLIFLVNDYKDFSILYDVLIPIVRKIEPDRPIITVLEDVDKLIEENGENDAELLDFLDGKNSIEHHVVIMTSNDTSNLSEAFLRPSRVDSRYIIRNPDAQIRKEYFEKKGVHEDKIKELVDATHNMSFAELKEVFVSTIIAEKPLDKVIKQIKDPINSKDYLHPTKNIGSFYK